MCGENKKGVVIEQNLKHQWFMEGWNAASAHYKWWDIKITWIKLFCVLLIIEMCLHLFYW